MSSLNLIWDDGSTDTLWSESYANAQWAAYITERVQANLFKGLLIQNLTEPEKKVDVILKIARRSSSEEMKSLKNEAGFYGRELVPLQGDVVPRFYGLWSADIRGVEFACLILDTCISVPITDPREAIRQAVVSASKIHSVGVSHKNLDRSPSPFYWNGKAIMFVDFSGATRHECRGAVPNVIHFCEELTAMERFVHSTIPGGAAAFTPRTAWYIPQGIWRT